MKEKICEVKVSNLDKITPPTIILLASNRNAEKFEFSYLTLNYTMRRLSFVNLTLFDVITNEKLQPSLFKDLSIGTYAFNAELSYFYVTNHLEYDSQKVYLGELPIYLLHSTDHSYSLTTNIYKSIQNHFKRYNVQYTKYVKRQTVDCVTFPETRQKFYMDEIQPRYRKKYGYETQFLPRYVSGQDVRSQKESFDKFKANFAQLKVDLSFVDQESCDDEVILLFESSYTSSTMKVWSNFYDIEIHINARMLFNEFIILVLNAIGVWCNISIVKIFLVLVEISKNRKLV